MYDIYLKCIVAPQSLALIPSISEAFSFGGSLLQRLPRSFRVAWGPGLTSASVRGFKDAVYPFFESELLFLG